MFYRVITVRFIIMIVFIIGFVSPLAGYGFSLLYKNYSSDIATLAPPERTNSELQTAIDEDRKSIGEDFRYPVSKVVSKKRMHDSWYVVTVKQTLESEYSSSEKQDFEAKVLIGDFYNSADKLKVIVRPGEALFRKNISYSAGVPYDVIEELNSKPAAKDTANE